MVVPAGRPRCHQRLSRVVAICVVMAAGVLSACGAQPVQTMHVVSRESLAGLTVRGGLCASGPCHSDLRVSASGDWTRNGGGSTPTPGPGAHAEGRLTQEQLGRLRAAIDLTTLEQAPANTRPCATASDGMELVITWAQAGVEHSISSCERLVPVEDPLVMELEALLYSHAPTGKA